MNIMMNPTEGEGIQVTLLPCDDLDKAFIGALCSALAEGRTIAVSIEEGVLVYSTGEMVKVETQ